MEDLYAFLTQQYYLPLYLIVWLVAVFRYRSYFDTPLKYFPIFLMYTFLTELLGYFIKYHDQFQFFSEEEYSWHNVIIYNIYSVITSMFFFYIYWKILKNPRYKNWVVYGTIASILGYVISLFFQDPLHANLYYADLGASLLLLSFIGLYFKEKRKEPGPYLIKNNLMFWTSLGLGVFYASSPFLFVIAYEIPEWWTNYRLRDVLKALIVFMYGAFMIGLLLGRRKAFN